MPLSLFGGFCDPMCPNTCNINQRNDPFNDFVLCFCHQSTSSTELWVCLYIKVYLIYHFIYLLFLFSVKRAYGGFLAIQCLVILCILALKVMDIQIDFIRWLSVYKNIKTLFLIKTFMVIHVVTDKYRPVFVVLFFLSKVSISVQ